MLLNSFQHFKGIGPSIEAKLWASGVVTWDQLESSKWSRGRAERGIEESRIRYAAGDAGYFCRALPASQRWRAYPDFAADAAFLDIETTGYAGGESFITVAGLLDRSGYRAYVRGQDLDQLPEALSRHRVVVTFNGSSFDLPFIASEYGPECFASAAHVDLRHVMRQAGYTGGLKLVERRTGLGRPSVLANLGGADAVTLWRMAEEGEIGAMQTLVRYNAEDVASLPRLAALAVEKLSTGTPLEQPALPVFPVAAVSRLPYDRSLIDFLIERRPDRVRW
jgi:hypothetical protein